MGTFVLRRMLISFPILFLVITLVFFAFHILPGDAALIYAGDQASLEEVERIRKDLGLDRPILVQYTSYLTSLTRGDLGQSVMTRRPVIVEIKDRFLNTVKLSVAAITMATILGLTMGTVSAVQRAKLWDYVLSVIAIVGISIPNFWLALLLMYLFSVKLGILPTAGNDTWRHYFMPTFCLALYSIAFITRMTRSSVLETLGEDYVRTARAKGLSEFVVLTRHALRNALLPIVTVIGLRFGYMLGGAVILESVFSWPGMGRLFITAVNQRDAPVVQGVLVVFATVFVLINLLVDIAYGFVDPRIRYQ